MSENRCGTCRFWGSDKGDPQGVYRPCRAIIHDERSDTADYKDDAVMDPADHWERSENFAEVRSKLAVVVDGSGYFAALKCREDFGCILWQPTDQPGEAGEAK